MATVTFTLEDRKKAELDEILDEMGLNTSTFLMLHVMKVLRGRRIPFEIEAISDDSFYSEANMKHLRKSIAQLNSGHGVEHELIETE